MERVRVGVIGAAGRAAITRHWVGDARVEIVGVADVNPQSIQWYRENIKSDIWSDADYRRLIERNDIDAIVVMSPDWLHEEHAVAALLAGKHVYVEKPMAITVEGCDRMIQTAKESRRLLMVGFNMRYMAIFQTMKFILDRGDIGDIKAVWVRHFVGRGGEYYFHDWHGQRKHTTSLLLQKGTHDFDMIHWLTGRYTSKVAAFGSLDYYGGEKPNDLTCPQCAERERCWDVQPAWPGHELCAFRKEIDVEDNQVVILELEGGIKASYLQCHFTPDYHRNYTIIGTEGRIENSEPESKVWVINRRTGTRKSLADATYHVTSEEGHGNADQKILNEFITAIIEGRDAPVDPWAGRMSVATGVLAANSLRNGGLVQQMQVHN
ncbi:MAG: Gfo/Idh/MocA family oxidoreductase [Firmicutes bacterium]|nr:Gfo/Idh/MocA family oxidoreductase [Bacillota bacterium]